MPKPLTHRYDRIELTEKIEGLLADADDATLAEVAANLSGLTVAAVGPGRFEVLE